MARGQSRKFSDIDLCVLTEPGVSKFEQLDLLSYGSRKIDLSLFQDLPLAIRFRVIREGKLLWCRDRLALHRIIICTLRQYLDFATFLRRHSLHAMGISR